MRSVSLVLVLLSSVFAGCVSGEGANSQVAGGPGPGQGPVATGEHIPDAGTIRGLVVDDSQAPLEGATVALVSLGLHATTDSGGAFAFGNLAPGPYDLNAIKLGYSSSAKRVEVLANQELNNVVLVLSAVVIHTAYHEVFGPQSGYFECFFGTPAAVSPCTGDTYLQRVDPSLQPSTIVFPNDKRRFEFTMSADHWATMVGESRWTPPAAATGAGMAIYPSYAARSNSHWWCEADGRSPLVFRYEAADVDLEDGLSACTTQGDTDPPPSMELNPLIIAADAGFGTTNNPERPPVRLLYQQRFEIMITMFYGEPAPEGYTALADA